MKINKFNLEKILNKFICGDSLQKMKKLPSKSIDLIFTSPPYNLKNSTGNGMKDGRGGKWSNARLIEGYDNHDDCMPHDEYVKWQRKCLKEMLRLIKDDGAIFYNHKWRVQNGLLQDRADIVKGFPVRQIIIWKRKGGINFNPGYFLPTYEVIYLICKKPFKLAKGANSFGDIWEFTQDMNNEHPAPFPLELAKRVVQSTNAQIVLDPFMGSGTTAIAAALLDRKFIGIELSPEYVKISKKRYNNIFGNLFGVDMKTFTKESLIQELKEIKNKGPVLNNRGSNNGASGNVLEDLLGIEENNLPLANAAEWEIKTKKRSSNSLITLFHVEPSPTACKFVPNILLPKYGWKHKEAGKKYPDTEKSFRQTIKCGLFSDRGFSIKLNDTEEKIEVNFRYDLIDQKHNEWKQDISTFQTLDTIPYWGFNDIYHKLGAKLHNCFFAIVDVCKRGDDEYFTYSEIYMLRNLSKDKFISAIRDGKIYIDFDARTGHNHGTKFRIKEKDIFDLYEECIEISNL